MCMCVCAHGGSRFPIGLKVALRLICPKGHRNKCSQCSAVAGLCVYSTCCVFTLLRTFMESEYSLTCPYTFLYMFKGLFTG